MKQISFKIKFSIFLFYFFTHLLGNSFTGFNAPSYSDVCATSVGQCLYLELMVFDQSYWFTLLWRHWNWFSTDCTDRRVRRNVDEIIPQKIWNMRKAVPFSCRMVIIPRTAIKWLEVRFSGRQISKKSDFMWPPCSLNPNPLVFIYVGLHEGRNSRSQA